MTCAGRNECLCRELCPASTAGLVFAVTALVVCRNGIRGLGLYCEALRLAASV